MTVFDQFKFQLMSSFIMASSLTQAMCKWKDVIKEVPATWELAKKMYRKACLVHHPDKGGNPDVFKKLNQAFEVLQESHVAGTIADSLKIWKVMWMLGGMYRLSLGLQNQSRN